MALLHFQELFRTIENELLHVEPGFEYRLLNKIPAGLFGLALFRRDQMSNYPKLQSFLLPLPDEEIQERFVGCRGEKVLPATLSFANYLETVATRLFGRSDLRYLDYGCGWGRFTRFLVRMTPIDKITAVDPNPDVKNYLGGEMLAKRFTTIPATPSVGDIPNQHEIAFLFSVMTHTPPSVNEKIIEALKSSLDPGGLLITTIRPRSYWVYTDKFWGGHSKEELMKQHDEQGYAYMPFTDNPNYGDSSYDHQFFVSQFKGFELVEATYCVVDPFQIIYTFRKKS